jgi:rifampicin phosphotransferase
MLPRSPHWLLVLFAVAGLAPPAGMTADLYAADDPARRTRVKRLASVHEIPDEATWHRLAARPAASSTARTEVVKFLLDVEDRRRLWFTDTERYPFHYYFARDRLSYRAGYGDGHAQFNAFEYHHEKRRFEMGSIVHYLDADLWTLELVSGDNLSGERIVRLFETIRDALWVGNRLRFRPLSELHERSIAAVRERLPLVDTDAVFQAVRYQPLTTGRTFGYLRVVRGRLDPGTVRADQILVLDHLPEEIPVSAGVVSQELQAPLGHIALLCATRGTPNMALRDVVAQPEWRELDGRLVELTVGPQEYSLRTASVTEAEKAWSRRRPKRPRMPVLDLSERRLIDLAKLRLRDARFAGAKAAQLGEVTRVKGVVTPGGFVIPIAHYRAHLEACGAARDLAGRLQEPAFLEDAGVRERWLADTRSAIENAPVSPELVQQVRARMQALAPGTRWILRSSTNAEDLAGFTGAGLYRSERVGADPSEDELARAIRRVWASVWLQGAFEERAWYRIDHSAVGMAVLVQPFVDGAVANGVAITANPFAEMRPGYLINAQALGGSVTGAGGNEIPEQHLVYTFTDGFSAEVLSRSSRTGGQPLLTEEEIKSLAGILGRLHRHFVPKWRGPANAVDVEFLVAGADRHIVIVQARPFKVTYARGQRLDDLPRGDVTTGPGGLR